MWWTLLGYPPFEEGPDGFPQTGAVIKFYRERKKNESGKRMSQTALANKLGIKLQAMFNIENKNTKLDLGRRQALCDLLDIPPLLLGVVTAAEITQLVQNKNTIDITSHQKFLEEAHALHQHATAVLLLDITRLKLSELYRQLPDTNSAERPYIYELLVSYHIFLAGELRELEHYDEALGHLDLALDFANLREDKTRQTVVELHRARILEVTGRVQEAVERFNIARLGKESYALKSMGLCYMSQLYAEVAQSETDKKAAIVMLEQGGTIARAHPEQVYICGLDHSIQGYYLRRAHAFIAAGWCKEALHTLDQVECAPGSWWCAYRSLYYAQAYLKMGKLELVVPSAEEVVKIARGFQSPMNLSRVAKIHKQLVDSPHGKSKEVKRLGEMLINEM